MTTASPSLPLTPAPAGARRFAGLGELFLVGGLTPLLFPISWLLRRRLGLDAAELAVGFTFFHAAHVINDPHFSVTYLLFYEDARARAFGDVYGPLQRARYLLAGFVVPLLLGAWAVWALAHRSAPAIGWMVQLMFLLVGWHYVKQGFGVMAVLAARRGVTFLPRERWAILAHCFAGWAFAWAEPAQPARELEEHGVVYLSVAHPLWLEQATRVAFLLTIPPVLWLLAQKWRRERRFPLLTPLTALFVSVWAWLLFSSADPLVLYAIPALHSIQYLYFVWLMKSAEARERERAPWFERSARVRMGILVTGALALGWVLFHLAPWALDDGYLRPGQRDTDLGPTPFLAVFATFVNIHHYFMDHVIWRRENPATRYLRASPGA